MDSIPRNYLFTSYCKIMYGLCLWNHTSSTTGIAFKTFDTAYSSYFKRMLKVPTFSSSHITAAILGQLLFKHYISLLKIRYFKRILKSSLCLIRVNRPALYSGHFGSDVLKCMERYNVTMNDDIDAIESRLNWVQNPEERRGVCIYTTTCDLYIYSMFIRHGHVFFG